MTTTDPGQPQKQSQRIVLLKFYYLSLSHTGTGTDLTWKTLVRDDDDDGGSGIRLTFNVHRYAFCGCSWLDETQPFLQSHFFSLLVTDAIYSTLMCLSEGGLSV